MNIAQNRNHTSKSLDVIAILIFTISLVFLSTIVFEGYFAPILLFIVMIVMSIFFIILFSNKHEILLKIKLFVFFFSLYLLYALINHYLLLSYYPNYLPFDYIDEETLYKFSYIGLPYVSGEKFFFDLFSVFKISELPLHVVFSSLIAYFSIIIDGTNSIIVHKLLSPFLGGLFSVVLFSTLKYQFKDFTFALNATLAYGLFSAIFIYSTPLLRDVDIALAYMIFIYLFLQKISFINFVFLFLIAFITIYLRVESGMVLFGLILLYSYLHIRKLQSTSIKLIFYIFFMVLFSLVAFIMKSKIIGMIVRLDDVNTARSIAAASAGSFGVLLNKLPFPMSYIAKVSFGQLQPFPIFIAIDDMPIYVMSGIFWPFIFIMMLYAVLKKNIRILIDEKVKYLLIVAIAILFLMSSEPMTRRMMSVYPIIYITALYVFYFIKINKIKKIFTYYLFGIIVLNTFYYLIKT